MVFLPTFRVKALELTAGILPCYQEDALRAIVVLFRLEGEIESVIY